MTAPITFAKGGIAPSFFRITASMLNESLPGDLSEALARDGFSVEVLGTPITPIYRSPTFQVQFGRRVSGAELCPVAEDQAARRVSIRYQR